MAQNGWSWLLNGSEWLSLTSSLEVSMLPVALLNVTAGCRCLDACAAPGGKTAQMLCSLAKALGSSEELFGRL